MDKNIGWMYEGPKSLVNREDYLLGKKIDKNFELYSDVVTKDKEDKSDLFAKKPADAPSTSAVGLPVMVVRQEDPLAALKIREAKRRQAMLENPVFKMKAQKVLMKEFEKLQKKSGKKHKKKHKKHSKHDSSDKDSSSESPPPKRERSRSRSPAAHRKKSRDERSASPRRRRPRRSRSASRSPVRRRSPSPTSSIRPRDHEPRTHRTSHREKSRSPRREKSRSPVRSSHRHERDRRSSPDRSHRDRSKHKNDGDSRASKAAEMERKRREMMENAQWKEQVREDNVKFARRELEKEVADSNEKNATFIKAFKQRTEGTTVAERIKDKRARLRRHSNDLDD